MNRCLIRIGVSVVVLLSGFSSMLLAVHAVQTAPLTFVYNGHLLNSAGTPVTSAVSVRFSFWKASDAVAGDITATGAVNTAAVNYADWSEVHTTTPDGAGYFSLILGSNTGMPDFSQIPLSIVNDMYIQVEVKFATAADTAYEILDINPTDVLIDRSPILSVPFARNADFLDQREIGTTSGSIALLGTNDRFDSSLIPSDTDDARYTIDANGTETGSVSLQFGTGASSALSFDVTNDLFEFNNDVTINGALEVTGLINGVDVTKFVSGVLVSAETGAGLTTNITAGNVRVAGVELQYPGVSNAPLTDNATNYAYLTATGLTITTVGYPTHASYIPVGELVTSGGIITDIVDGRLMQVDDRERVVTKSYQPLYEGAGYESDGGGDNVGRLKVDFDDPTQQTHYRWTSTKNTLQDYRILLRVPLPDDFLTWDTVPITVMYRSTSGAVTANKLDITAFDSTTAPVVLTGTATNLVNTVWDTTTLGFAGTPTWVPGGDVLLEFSLSARLNEAIDLGKLILRYKRL